MDGPITVYGFPALPNRGDVNENETTDEMYWSAMVQEEVQDQINDYDKLDICPIDVLLCYWKSLNGNLMLRINGLGVLGEDTVKADDVKIYYPYTLALYLIGTSIGVKKSRRSRNFGVDKEWHEWAARFTNSKMSRIARLFRILGNYSLEDVFGSQVTMSMMRPLRYH